MPRLHLLNKAPDHARFGRCLASIASDDTLVLMENAVLAVTGDHGLPAARTVALAEDLEARGLATGADTAVGAISIEQLVALTETHTTVISW